MTGRRSRSRIVAVLLMALLVLVIGVRWGASASSGRRVLIVARPVAAGGVLTPDDLGVARLGRSGGELIDADRADVVAGRVAAVDLLPGTPLIPAMLTDEAVPGAGYAVVGVSVESAALPAEVGVGVRVRVVGIPAADDPGAILAATARVLSMRSDEQTGAVALSLLLAETDADRVVRAAASSGVSLVLLARAGATQ
jgi:hypothetical protein